VAAFLDWTVQLSDSLDIRGARCSNRRAAPGARSAQETLANSVGEIRRRRRK